MTVKEALLFYHKQGLPVIPLKIFIDETGKYKKVPVIKKWEQYQNQIPSLKETNNWFEKLSFNGIGLIMGKISGITLVDFDNYKKEKLFFELPPTIQSRTISGGNHYFYKYQQGLTNSTKSVNYIDIKNDGGYAVIPPSEGYEWLNADYLDVKKLAVFPKNLYLKLTTGKKKKQTTSWEDFFQPVRNEGERNTAAMQGAGILLVNNSLTTKYINIAWRKLVQWNQEQCNPPLDEQELESCFNNTLQREQKSRSKESSTNIQRFFDFPIYTNKGLEIKSVGQILADTNKGIDWVVEKLVPTQSITLIFGKSSVGKSYFMLSIIKAILEHRGFLDKFKTSPANILYIGEDPHHVIGQRIKQLAIQDDFNYAQAVDLGFSLDSTSGINNLLEQIRGFDLVIFDPLRDFMIGDENSSEVMSRVHNNLKIINSHGITVIVIHHEGKIQEGLGYGGLDAPRGSSVITDMAQSTIRLKPQKDNTILLSQPKLKVDLAIKDIVLLRPDFSNHSNGDFKILQRKEKIPTTEKVKKFILQLLEKEGELQQKDIKEKVSTAKVGSKTTAIDALSNLEMKEAIKVRPDGPRKYYSLPTGNSAKN